MGSGQPCNHETLKGKQKGTALVKLPLHQEEEEEENKKEKERGREIFKSI